MSLRDPRVDICTILIIFYSIALWEMFTWLIYQVSYKWLSRNFSVSSNDAKRLLQEYVQKYGNGLEVVYALSGWLKENPETYHIRLVPGIKLSDVKQEYKENYSVQVYSVQACIPKDPAVIWSAEFVQAEELFDQPSATDNCLRDNRFCGISNSFVKRTTDGKSTAIGPTSTNNGHSFSPKTNCSLQNFSASHHQKEGLQRQNPTFTAHASSSTISGSKVIVAAEVDAQSAKIVLNNENSIAPPVNKMKNHNDKAPVTSASLANLWNRASTKSKTSSFPTDSATTAEAQIAAQEALDATSSDDETQNIRFKREQNGSSGRKRKAVFEFSDDEDEENIVSLASPESPIRKPVPEVKVASLVSAEPLTKTPMPDANSVEQMSNKMNIKQGKTTENNSALLINGNNGGMNKTITSGGEKTKECVSEGSAASNKEKNDTNPSVTLPRRKKVLKTRIDERGREVTEVIWEDEGEKDKDAKKATPSNANEIRPPVANKPETPNSTAPTKPVGKAGNKKTGKAGTKDAKQGNILSFFKKM